MTIIEERWSLIQRENGYAAVPDTESERQALNAIGHTTFRAVSVGRPDGQVAIIPLDESSVERGRLIARAPEMARLLLRVFVHIPESDPYRKSCEDLLKELGLLPV